MKREDRREGKRILYGEFHIYICMCVCVYASVEEKTRVHFGARIVKIVASWGCV